MERMVDEYGNDNNTLIEKLPYVRSAAEGSELSLFQGYWYPSRFLHHIFSLQKNFESRDDDLILATMPKSGTSWLAALTFTIANRTKYPVISETPLLITNPLDLVFGLETSFFRANSMLNFEEIPSPRILQTHVPYSSLPHSISSSNCRVVYMCRNPLDQFISLYYFVRNIKSVMEEGWSMDLASMDKRFDELCDGVSAYGPIWDHILGYWEASKETPEKVLFLKYEDLKEDIVSNLKVLAKFMGCPFSIEEEKQGVIEEISRVCSFENLRDLEVNKIEKNKFGLPNSSFFRKGKVGDWANHLTPSMADRLKKIFDEKLMGSGLHFKFN